MNTKQQIAIYGYGYVGRAVFQFLKAKFQLLVVDPTISPVLEVPHIAFRKSDELPPVSHAIISVPTGMLADGSCDTSIVEDIVTATKHQYYLIKSTVAPGTTANLVETTGKRVAFSPEFIGEGNYEIPYWEGYQHPTDMKKHHFFIFGGERKVTSEWLCVWQKVMGWAPVYEETDSTTAEIVKYAENAYLACQKMFFDQIYDIAEANRASYNKVKNLLLHDKRVSPALSVIYPGARGFGGKCLPKDVSAIVIHMEKLGRDPHFFKAILASNKKFRSETL